MTTLLILMLCFQVKHLFIDYFFQTKYEYENKGNVLHPGGWQHAFKHGLATWLIIMFVAAQPISGLVFGVIEVVLHYAIDWTKVNMSKLFKWSQSSPTQLQIFSNWYFHAIGIDQFLHQLTYALIIAFLCL